MFASVLFSHPAVSQQCTGRSSFYVQKAKLEHTTGRGARCRCTGGRTCTHLAPDATHIRVPVATSAIPQDKNSNDAPSRSRSNALQATRLKFSCAKHPPSLHPHHLPTEFFSQFSQPFQSMAVPAYLIYHTETRKHNFLLYSASITSYTSAIHPCAPPTVDTNLTPTHVPKLPPEDPRRSPKIPEGVVGLTPPTSGGSGRRRWRQPPASPPPAACRTANAR